MRLKLTFMLNLFLITGNLSSQTPASAILNVNQVKARINADGDLFNSSQFIAPYSAGQPELSLLRRAGLWMTGNTGPAQFVCVVEPYPSKRFAPGPLDENGQPYPTGILTDIYRVSRADIELHRADFADNGVIDQALPSVFGWPARGNPFFAQYHNGQQLPMAQEGWAGFADVDNDGSYNPVKGDYPAPDIPGCPNATAPDEMLWFVYHPDTTTSVLTSIGMEIHCQVFAFHCVDESPLNNAVFVRYKLVYKGTFPVNDFHYGLYNSITIGYPGDNYFGCDTSRNMIFGYNADQDDEGAYGNDIPAFGMKVLQEPSEQTGQSAAFARVYRSSAADLVPHFYHYFRMSRQYLKVENFQYPGNPADPGAYTEISAGNKPGVRDVVGSLGPKTLLPGDVDEIVAVYFFALKPGNTPVQNVQALYAGADELQDFFNNCFTPPGHIECRTLADAPALPAPAAGLKIFPNPASQSFAVESESAGIARVQLGDLTGRRIFSQYLAGVVSRVNIPVAGLPDGIYLAEIWLENGARAWEKVVVSR